MGVGADLERSDGYNGNSQTESDNFGGAYSYPQAVEAAWSFGHKNTVRSPDILT
jgi:hypothetical protein